MVQSYSPGGANVHPYVIYGSFDPPHSASQNASRSVQPFLHSSRLRVPILYNGHFLPQNCLFTWGSGPNLMHSSFGPPEPVHIPNGISISSAIFAGLTIVTDRQTDRQTDHATPSVTIGRIYVVLRCSLKSTKA